MNIFGYMSDVYHTLLYTINNSCVDLTVMGVDCGVDYRIDSNELHVKVLEDIKEVLSNSNTDLKQDKLMKADLSKRYWLFGYCDNPNVCC